MRIRKTGRLLLLLLLCLALSGCRTRTTGGNSGSGLKDGDGASGRQALSGPASGDAEDESDLPDEQEKNEDPGGRTKENPEAPRKEYDENAPAEIVPGTDRKVHSGGEGDGASAAGEDSGKTADKLNDSAEETAVQTVAAEEAEQKGVSGDAEEADSALSYFTVLLQDRTGSLFECQRLNVYWETAEDHVTVFRTSQEHSLILNAGAYDVSARLLEENLRVDDGWIGRKNPGVIVKAVDGSILGAGIFSTDAAERVYTELLAREGWAGIDAVQNGRVLLLSEELLAAPWAQVAAMLLIAGTANPELMADTDAGQALEMLAEEATGSIPQGIYYYKAQGGLR